MACHDEWTYSGDLEHPDLPHSGLPVAWRDSLAGHQVAALGRPASAACVCHCVCVDEDLWDAYDRMGLSFQQHAADSAANAHYDRPAVLAALGQVSGRQVLDAACGPGLYLRELLG
jgi:hypothetical protein